MKTPPRTFEWILKRLLLYEDREFVTGDLEEIYAELEETSGPVRAKAWYLGQIFRSLPRFAGDSLLWRYEMFKNYLLLALRHVRKYPGYSFINIFGLAIGMACCILIFLWVRDELSYDRFHANVDDLYRITVTGEQGTWSSSPWALIPTLKTDYPEIVRGTWYGVIPLLARYGENSHFEDVALVGEDFPDMFTFPFINGRPESAFSNPNSVVLTRKAAARYFGTRDPLGEIIQFENRIDLMVTGVVEDVPRNSHMKFDLLVSPIPLVGEERMQTWSMDVDAYVQLPPGTDPRLVEEKISGTIIEHDKRTSKKYYVGLFPVKDIHLRSLSGTDPIVYVYVFSAIAVIVLLIACVNFMNLATARASTRRSEIGIRKVLGGVGRDLVKQFLGESMGLALAALIVAVVLVYLLLPGFNSLTEKQLEFGLFRSGPLLAGLILFALFSGLVAGSYPAFYLSSFQPQRVLKGSQRSGSGKSGLRKLLIISQFCASILLIIATVSIYKQIQYIRSRDLGFSKDRVIVVRARQSLREKYEAAKERLLAHPDILNVTAASSIPLGIGNNNPVYWEGRGPDDYVSMNFVCVDYDYFETFGMSMSHGRSFSREYPTDRENYIINEAALRLTGYDDPVGKMFSMWQDEGTLVGVVKDFHGTSLHNDIRPIVFVMYQNLPYSYWFIKVRGSFVRESMDHVKTTVASVVPGYPVEPRFLDEYFQDQYVREARLGRILRYFSLLAVFVSCLGLFGLAAFMAARRSREIAIRKVLGATNARIMGILSREFLLLIGLATFIAWPLGFLIMNRWMENFAYHAPVGMGVFLLAGVAALAVALLTVSYHTFRAATASPADRLRNE